MLSNSLKIGIISQARMTSTRLPGKVLLPIADQPLLHYHVSRLLESKLPMYLAITHNATDDPLAEFAEKRQLPCTRGDEQDVLGRYYQCAVENQLDIIVRVTSDCPLLDGQVIAESVQEYVRQQDPRLYLSNVLQRTFPRGFDFEAFSQELLNEAFHQADLPADREHVTPYIHQNRSGRVRFEHVTRSPDRSQYRLTVDTPDDFRLIKLLIEEHNAASMTFDEIIALLDQQPELAALDAHIEQKKL